MYAPIPDLNWDFDGENEVETLATKNLGKKTVAMAALCQIPEVAEKAFALVSDGKDREATREAFDRIRELLDRAERMAFARETSRSGVHRLS